MKKSKRLSLLFDDGGDYTEEDIKELWEVYRYGKLFACFGEICEWIAAYSMTSNDECFSNIEYKEEAPRAGSPYWLETIDPPSGWREKELY